LPGGSCELLGRKLLLELLAGGGGWCGGQGCGVPVGGIEGVDEGVDTSAVGAGRNSRLRGLLELLAGSLLELLAGRLLELLRSGLAGRCAGGLATKVGAVYIELEVPVSRVVGVDKGVVAGRLLGACNRLSGRKSSLGRLGRGKVLDRGRCKALSSGLLRWCGAVIVFVVIVHSDARLDELLGLPGLLHRLLLAGLGRVLSVGAGGHMVSLEDPESIPASGVFHCDGLAVCVNVAVLANTLAIGCCLLPVHGAILLGVRCAESSIPCIEPLFLEDLRLLWFNKLSNCRGGKTRGDY